MSIMSILIAILSIVLFMVSLGYCLVWMWLYHRGWKHYILYGPCDHYKPQVWWAKGDDPSRYWQPNIYRAMRWELGWDTSGEIDPDEITKTN